MNYFELILGSIVTLLGLSIVGLTIMFLRANRMKNIFTGSIFVLFGTAIIWAAYQGSETIYLNFEISDKQTSLLILSFVLGLFILKGVLELREGSRNLQDKSDSSFQVFKEKFRIVVAIIITTIAVVMLIIGFLILGG